MENKGGLRLYSFGNMYLQGVQAGIQCAHCVAELFVKYDNTKSYLGSCMDVNEFAAYLDTTDILYDWAKNHQTTILLNGGMKKDLVELRCFIEDGLGDNKLPWAYFNESVDALSGVITNVSIVVPERVYNLDREYLELDSAYSEYYKNLTEFEFELAKRIKRCRLIG